MSDYCILVPAYNPDERLITLVDNLINQGNPEIIIVDDGSIPEFADVFERLKSKSGCHILHHAVNLGKGRALKTGFNYFYIKYKDKSGLVTADADGQHSADDIVKIGCLLGNKIILGTRRFDKDVPLRSRIGNLLTKYVFLMIVGKNISDTQSGLRGIPTQFVPKFLPLSGERYEYELNMLIETRNLGIDIREVAISTIYIDDNKSSHFNPLYDSLKIYFVFIRFSFSSLLASGSDLILFYLIYLKTQNIMLSIVTGRVVIGGLVFFCQQEPRIS